MGRSETNRQAARGLPVVVCGYATVCALFLGGGTRGGFLSDAVLELLTLPAAFWVGWRLCETGLSREVRHALMFCGAVILVPLVQLIPLPPAVWSALPGRTDAAQALRSVGDLPWGAISLAPVSTAQAALSLIPTFAVFAGTLLLDAGGRERVSLAIAGVGIVSVLLGFAQMAGGPDSLLRPYSSGDVAVGLFANRNHFALMLCVCLAFVGARGVANPSSGAKARRRRDHKSPAPFAAGWLVPALAGIAALVLFAGILATRSRAGLGLAVLALAGVAPLARLRITHIPGGKLAALMAGGALVVAIGLAVVAPDLIFGIAERVADGESGDRFRYTIRTLAIAVHHLPFGTGVGSFVPVYAVDERRGDMLDYAYLNRAHDDWVEITLESGILGPILLAIFVVWFARRAIRIWRDPPSDSRARDINLTRVATLVIALIGLHAFVEYPLRTGAMMAIFAFACGLLFRPLEGADAMSSTSYGLPRSDAADRRLREAAVRASSGQPQRP